MVQQATKGAQWTGYFKFVTAQPSLTKMTDSQEMADAGSYNNFTWYQRLIQGSASRMTRYREFDLMDNHIDVARALDTIAEEITGNNVRSDEPLDVILLTAEERNPESTTVVTLRTALRRWFRLNEFDSKLFPIVRHGIKYGDCFFKRGKTVWDKWTFVHPKNVIAAIVDDKDVTNIIAWQIKKEVQRPMPGYGLPLGGKNDNQNETEIVSAKDIIRFTLADDMCDSQPFGESILRPVYRTHKQMELLEDAILIYRIQRAPERRVFKIDVGKMPPQRVKTYLEGIKNEIKQKRVPNANGGQSEMDTVYNPHSMAEDFFFACISLKTKVFLLDGREITLDEARKEYEEGKENWTYSVDQKTGKLIPGKIAWAGYTRRNADMVRVHLDNGESIDCTPDHKFVLKDGSEVEAQNLTPEMSLMPLYRKKVKTNKNQKEALYELVLDNSTGKWKFTHLEVQPKKDKNNVIHHCDYNPRNNSPTNLLEMTKDDHWKLHSDNGHALGTLWKEDREKMIRGIRNYHDNRTEEQTKILVERNRKNGSKTFEKYPELILENLKKSREYFRSQFDSYEDYCEYMSDMAKIQWTDEKKLQQSKETIEFNKKTKSYNVDENLLGIFVSLYNEGANSNPKMKEAMRNSSEFMMHFIEINEDNEKIKNGKDIPFSEKFIKKIVNYGGYNTFLDFKNEYKPNHRITEVEVLPYKEDTGCLHVVDPDENHNFALGAGVYVKNSRPDGRGSSVETLPGGQNLGELADLEYFQRKVWRGLRIPVSYMMEQDGGGAMFNDGKVGMAYIQELRFALFVSRLQVQLEKTLDKEFKKFLAASNIKIDEDLYEIRLPEPSNFGKYRQLELDTQLLGAYASADGVMHLSKRFALRRYLQLSDEDIITNERLKAEELGLDPDAGTENYQQIYGVTEGGEMGGGMGGMGGGFAGGGMDAGMGGMEGEAGMDAGMGGEAGGAGAVGGAPPAGGA